MAPRTTSCRLLARLEGRGDGDEGQKAPPAPEAAAPPEFDMSDPSSSSYGEGARFLRDMLDPSARITDPGARVLHWAERIAMADLVPNDREYLDRSRDLFALAIATLNDPHAPEEARRQANDTAIRSAFDIGEIKGRISTSLWGRKAWPRAHTDKATSDRVNDQAKAIARRHEQILAVCEEWNTTIHTRGIYKQLAFELGASTYTIKDDLKALREQRRNNDVAAQ